MTTQSIVSIVECADYEPESVGKAVRQAITLAELDSIFQRGCSVLVKPNLLSARRPEDAVTTHPNVVSAIARLAREKKCAVEIGDSPPFAGENATRWMRLCETTGMTEAANELQIGLRRFEEAVVVLTNACGKLYRSFEIAEAVANADIVVNVPKLKTHGLTVITGAVKNVFGCVPGIRKGLFHVRAAENRETFAQMLVDLCKAVRPAAHVMDAVLAMEGEGPSSGLARSVRAIIASSDPVAVDAVASALVDVEPFSVLTTRLGHEQRLGCGDLTRIEVRGTPIDQLKVRGFRLSSGTNDWHKIPAPIRHLLRRQLLASPCMDRQRCVGCGDCAKACPVNAIVPGRPPTVDYQRCIRCYCCQEVCSVSAVTLRLGMLRKIGALVRRKK